MVTQGGAERNAPTEQLAYALESQDSDFMFRRVYVASVQRRKISVPYGLSMPGGLALGKTVLGSRHGQVLCHDGRGDAISVRALVGRCNGGVRGGRKLLGTTVHGRGGAVPE